MTRWIRRGGMLAATGFLLVAGVSGVAAMELSSPDIPAGGVIDSRFEARGFGCAGANESPALRWTGAPPHTRSFAVTVYDPDAPSGSGWWHWVLVDVPATVHELKPGAGQAGGALLPPGASQIRNDYGQAAWGGLCPPPGARPHRYVFTVYALKTERLGLPQDATPALAGYLLRANVLAKASLVAVYGRPAR